MKRAFVFKLNSDDDGKVMVVDDTIEDFMKEISTLFHLENVRIFAANGCEIHDTRVLWDNEKIYVAERDSSESFKNSLKKLAVEDQFIISDWVTLNVGGKHFTTSRSTLFAKEPHSMLARMFANDASMNPSPTDSTGAYLIDRSPLYFEPILNYLRHGKVIIDKNVNPKGVLEEAAFFALDSMIPQLQKLIEMEKPASCCNADRQELTHRDVVHALYRRPANPERPNQDVNAEEDLNRVVGFRVHLN